MFAFQQYELLPDACSFAKGIAGGLPMSGIMANEKCRAVLTPGTHATTFGGNPICAAAGIAVQEILTDEVLALSLIHISRSPAKAALSPFCSGTAVR